MVKLSSKKILGRGVEEREDLPKQAKKKTLKRRQEVEWFGVYTGSLVRPEGLWCVQGDYGSSRGSMVH